jgi:hypothetical protein
MKTIGKTIVTSLAPAGIVLSLALGGCVGEPGHEDDLGAETVTASEAPLCSSSGAPSESVAFQTYTQSYWSSVSTGYANDCGGWITQFGGTAGANIGVRAQAWLYPTTQAACESQRIEASAWGWVPFIIRWNGHTYDLGHWESLGDFTDRGDWYGYCVVAYASFGYHSSSRYSTIRVASRATQLGAPIQTNNQLIDYSIPQ